jgi:hypothetical protein
MAGGDRRPVDLAGHRSDPLAQAFLAQRLEDIGEGTGGLRLHRSII